jgi:DNA polymerase-3 subunit gamma/tau
MVLIRLAHVADMPTPGDIIRRLGAEGSAGAAPAPRGGGSGGAGLRAIAGGGRVEAVAAAQPAPVVATDAIAITGLADIAALAVARREATLAAIITSRVHLVRIEDGLLEIRPDADAPRDLSPRLAALLSEATGRRWTVAVSTEAGAPTLAEVEQADAARVRAEVEQDALVRAILSTFPGATIEAIRDAAPVPHQNDPDTDPEIHGDEDA